VARVHQIKAAVGEDDPLALGLHLLHPTGRVPAADDFGGGGNLHGYLISGKRAEKEGKMPFPVFGFWFLVFGFWFLAFRATAGSARPTILTPDP
jgi:hypothetical protein